MPRSTNPRGNLPSEPNSFIGRRDDLASLRSRLGTARLISLVGPGGVGKTRLAIRVASELSRRFRDGAWLVELADIEDGALVGNAVLEALDLRDQAGTEPLRLVLSHLRSKDLLLIVDNCEHVLAAAGRLIADVVKSAPGVRVIATSREPLALASEQVFPVRPLELPAVGATDPLSLLQSNEAVSLFTERAVAALGSFEVSEANRDAVAEVCRRLDGLPLAIELAAVRTRVLSVEQIRDRLTDRFGFLTGGGHAALPRHQTLHTAIEWSHDLLTNKERTQLRRLSIFPAKFTLRDVEAICPPDDPTASDALDVLASLIDKSFVIKETVVGRACYRQHETIREYARIKLRDAGEEAATESRFVDYYRSECQRSAGEVRHRLVEWLGWMDVESDNVRSILQRALNSGDTALGLEVATYMWWYWVTRATTEGVRWLDAFLGLGHPSAASHGWASFIRGFLAVLQADPAAAQPVLGQAVKSARATGQMDLLVQSLSMASLAELWVGDHVSAARLLGEAQAAMESLDDAPALLGLLQARSLHGLAVGDLESVTSAASDGVRVSRATGDLYALDMMLLNLGLVALSVGDLDAARPLLLDGLGIAHQLDDRIAQFLWLDALAYHAVRSGEARLGAQLMGAAQTFRTEAGARVNVLVDPLRSSAVEAARAALGAAQFELQLEAGKKLSRRSALDLALGVTAGPARPAAGGRPPVLGSREADVARLVAQGLSNKEIGMRLFISDRTVESHVRSILNKLGVSSRVQIASWVSSPESLL